MRQAQDFDATEAGVPDGGAILVRPDGFIGFRAAPADETTMAALDAHLATYLVPDVDARDRRIRGARMDYRNAFDMTGSVAVVTGGSNGIG